MRAPLSLAIRYPMSSSSPLVENGYYVDVESRAVEEDRDAVLLDREVLRGLLGVGGAKALGEPDQ